MAIDRSKFLARFVEEAKEHCSRLSDDLLILEKRPGDREVLNSLFRAAHTIKGSARMMKLTAISELAHWMEELLDSVRSEMVNLPPQSFGLLFKSTDALFSMLNETEAGKEPQAAPAELCEALKNLASPFNTNSIPPADPKITDSQIDESSAQEESSFIDGNDYKKTDGGIGQQKKQAFNQGPGSDYLRVGASKLDELIRLMGEIISDHNRFRMNLQAAHEAFGKASKVMDSAMILLEREGYESISIRRMSENFDSARAAMYQAIQPVLDGVAMQHHLISELQDSTLNLRMIPLSTVFDPLRRNVRDLAMDAEKDVDFIVSGGETELDRKIAERIGDSLVHMIRNALDHGIENPSERLAFGKPLKGTIKLSAFYDGGGVTIVLKDDGRGLDLEKIKAKALSKKLFDPEALARMSKAEIHNLIFLPGFSTSVIITDISGRGVGMDVVRQNIVNELKGSITMDTQPGKGTSFFLHLPLNLAVFPLFMMKTSGTTVAVPATSIVEMHSIAKEDMIEILGKKAIRLREQVIPLESLSSILKLERKKDDCSESVMAVVRDGETKLAILVDEITGREDMVVKPLPEHLKNTKIVTGATIGQGDSVVNILHIPEVIRLAGETRVETSSVVEQSGSLILVVDDSVNTREIERGILEAHGYQVDTAEDGIEALEKTRETIYDLIVTDVEMPRMDGFSLTESLRADKSYARVPIIIVTSLEKESDRKRGITAGADAYIVKKAFDQSNLLDTIKSLIG